MPTNKQSSRRAQRAIAHQRQKRRRIAWVLGGVAAVAIVVVGFLTLGGGDDAFTIDVALDDFSIEGDLVAPAGSVRLNAVNVGVIPHNVGLRGGPISAELRPGGSTELDLGDLAPGTYELYCDVADHVEQGMVATLVVTD
jgi:hypothetical protein